MLAIVSKPNIPHKLVVIEDFFLFTKIRAVITRMTTNLIVMVVLSNSLSTAPDSAKPTKTIPVTNWVNIRSRFVRITNFEEDSFYIILLNSFALLIRHENFMDSKLASK